MKYNLYNLSVLLIVAILFMRCSNDSNNTPSIESNASVSTETKASGNQAREFSVNVIGVNGNQFGYDILINGTPYIHQPHIPAIGGVNGFSSKEKAKITGDFIIQKLNNNIMPPTVSLDELDSLGVLN